MLASRATQQLLSLVWHHLLTRHGLNRAPVEIDQRSIVLVFRSGALLVGRSRLAAYNRKLIDCSHPMIQQAPSGAARNLNFGRSATQQRGIKKNWREAPQKQGASGCRLDR